MTPLDQSLDVLRVTLRCALDDCPTDIAESDVVEYAVALAEGSTEEGVGDYISRHSDEMKLIATHMLRLVWSEPVPGGAS